MLSFVRPWGRWFRLALLMLTAGVLAGCATVVSAPDPLKSAPTANQSVVVVSLTGNTSQVGAADTISVKRRHPSSPGESETHILRQVAPGMARDTSLFIGTLPVGEYEFATFNYGATGQYLPFTDTMRARVGKFAVVGGTGIDLGRIVATPLNASILVGRSARPSPNLDIVRRFAPEYLKFFEPASAVQSGWQGPRSPTDHVEAYALATPVGADSPFEMADGSVVMGARLGSALLRSPEGKWSAITSDGLEALLCVRPGDSAETHLVAVGEFGTLLRASKGSTRFVKVDAGNLPPGNLLFIAGDSKVGWFVVLQAARDIQILRSPQLEKGQWTPLRKITLESSVWSGNEQFWVWTHERGFAYASGDGGVNRYDFASGEWTRQMPPKEHRIIGIASDRPDHLGILTSPGGGIGGAFAGQYFSKDGGATWREMKSEFSVKTTPPRRAGSGELITMGGVFSNPEMHASGDEGATWAKRSEYRLDQNLSILPSGLMLAASRGTFGLFTVRTSTDHGKTWRIEYSNFDRQAYEAQQNRR